MAPGVPMAGWGTRRARQDRCCVQIHSRAGRIRVEDWQHLLKPPGAKQAVPGHTSERDSGRLSRGALRKLYRFLTDRIGNVAELEPYFEFWSATPCKEGALEVVVIEHDAESLDVPGSARARTGAACSSAS